MSVLKIRPLLYPINHCFIYSLSAMVNFIRGEYELILGGTWHFELKRKSPRAYLGDRIETFNENVIKEIINSAYKIDYTWHVDEDAKVILNTINTQVSEGRPVGVTMDTYWCPWSPFYKKQLNSSIKNLILINGINKNNLYCLNNITKGVERISLDDFLKGYERYILFHFNQKSHMDINYETVLNNLVNSYHLHEKKRMFSEIRMLADELKEIDFAKEYENANTLDEAPLFKKLMQVEDSRYSFSKYLEYIGDKCNNSELIELSRKQKASAQMWGNIKGLLIKLAYIGENEMVLQKVCDNINRVAEHEESVFEDICLLV